RPPQERSLRMSKSSLLAGILCLTLAANAADAHVGWSLGINLGVPYAPRPWYPYPAYGYYYRPYYAPPVIYAPPLVVQPAPVVVQQPAVVVAQPQPTVVAPVPATSASVSPAPALVQAQHAGQGSRIDLCLQQL